MVEALLCSSGEYATNVYGAALHVSDGDNAFARRCVRLKDRILDSWPDGMYHHIAGEAAYRLIESSPTLRREWFGAP